MLRFFCYIFFASTLIFGQEIFEKAKLEFSKGNFQEVIETLKNIPEDSAYFDYWYMLGMSYQRLYNYRKAEQALYTAYRFNKLNSDLNVAIGRNYGYCGAPGYSLMFFKQANELDPSNISIQIELAESYVETKKYEQAIEAYQNLYTHDSTNAYFLKRIGHCLYKSGQINQAVPELKKSFELNPRDASVAVLLGGMYVNVGNYHDALKVIEDGLYYNGHSTQLQKLYAETLFKMRRYSVASIQYESIVADGDSTAANYQKLGFCHYLTEINIISDSAGTDSLKYLSAIEAFQKAIDKDSSDALSHVYLGICYKERGETEKAVKFLERGISLTFPEYLVDAYTQLASSYELSDKYAEAIQSYKKAGEYNPDRRTVIFQIASLYDKYYKDKNVPLLYYQKYLRDTKDQDPLLIEYARTRVNQLREQIHFGY